MSRRNSILLFAAMLMPAAGCAPMQDFHYKHSHKFSAYMSSLKERDLPSLDGDMKAGFRQGHYDLSTGRACKPPTLPPKKYWAPCYQSCKGQQAIANWYRGYELGMIAAEKECGGCFHIIRPHIDGAPAMAMREIFPPPMLEVDDVPVEPATPTPTAAPLVPTEMVPLVPQPDAVLKPQSELTPTPSLKPMNQNLFGPPKLTD